MIASRGGRTLLLACLVVAACRSTPPVAEKRLVATPAMLDQHCREAVGSPRVMQVTPNVYVAIGYDLANTILIRTPVGNVVVDAMMSPTRSKQAKAELLKVAPGPTKALILTHSHIDHVGGASEWAEPGTEIWATDAFLGHFIKQYGVFQKAEQRRGSRQFANHVPTTSLPCSALGRRPSFDSAIGSGARAPTKTFSGSTTLDFGGMQIELVEAHGETDDQLFVWVPSEKALMPGDNWYRAFPNLYTIRGTRPRPVGEWIASIDAMRARQPEHLVPSHTAPLSGGAAIRETLTDYRDAIEWIRSSVVRGANAGKPLDELANTVGLPPHLLGKRELLELYGQIDWSVRAIFTNELGWFDGDPAALYRPSDRDTAAREVRLMGGVPKVHQLALDALEQGDARWATHLLHKLQLSGLLDEDTGKVIVSDLTRALRAVAKDVSNTNGRGYLLESAFELEKGPETPHRPSVDDTLLRSIPIRVFFEAMPSRLKPEEAIDVVETLEVFVTDENQRYFLTVRRGVGELAIGTPLPGTPKPVATVETDALTWKRTALNLDSPAASIASGRLKVKGSVLDLKRFTDRFERGL
jgi:alkyl sulfatase BDS1-like metallo-beta-lactamase superfamily hydrolase